MRETKKLDQVRSLSGPEYMWRMTATLSQLELGLWKGFKQQKADRYKSEFDCFFDFSQERLEYWSDLADESRVMAFQQGAASVAQWPSRLVAMAAIATSHVEMTAEIAMTITSHQTTNPSLKIFTIFRLTVQLPTPMGPSSSLRSLTTLIPFLMLTLIIISPIGMPETSNVPFLAVTILGHMPGDNVICFCPFL